MARPTKELDKDIFEELCAIQCTLIEISGVFRVDKNTVEAWCKRTYNQGFSEVFEKFSANGKTSLRRSQFELAKRNAAMAIWLGKQYLGQKDVVEVESKPSEILVSLKELMSE